MEASVMPSPTYRIFRDKHGIPQFEPKRGTQALKDALIYSFPALETELQLMQAALRKFFDSERGSTFVFELPERDLQASLAKTRDVPTSPTQPGKASLRNWKVSRSSRTPSRCSSRASSRAPSRARSRASSRAGEVAGMFQELDLRAPAIGGAQMTTWMLSNGQELEKRKRQPYDAVKRRQVAENRGNACEKHRASKTACNPAECPQNKLYGKVTESRRRDSFSSASEPIENLWGSGSTSEQVTKSIQVAPLSPIIQADEKAMAAVSETFSMGPDQNHPVLDQLTAYSAFDYPTTTSISTEWTDIPLTSDMSWASCEIYPPIQQDGVDLGLDTSMDGVVAGIPAFTGANYPADQYVPETQALPADNPDQFVNESAVGYSILDTYNSTDATTQLSEDPFMGWASKKASHMFDDYGWVLSHVEAL